MRLRQRQRQRRLSAVDNLRSAICYRRQLLTCAALPRLTSHAARTHRHSLHSLTPLTPLAHSTHSPTLPRRLLTASREPVYEQPPLANIMSVVKEYDSRILDVLMGRDQFPKGADELFEREIAPLWKPAEASCLEKGLPEIRPA